MMPLVPMKEFNSFVSWVSALDDDNEAKKDKNNSVKKKLDHFCNIA